MYQKTKEREEKYKKNRGITLIALIVKILFSYDKN